MSFAIPFIACGGILVAVAIAFVPIRPGKPPLGGPDFSQAPVMAMLMGVGVAALTLMPAVLAGFIANAMGGKPGMVPGFVGGWIATHLPSTDGQDTLTAGFLGAMLAGLIAGYLVQALKKLPVPRAVRPVMPILVIPVIASTVVGVAMLLAVGEPIAHGMNTLAEWLKAMSSGNAVLLAVILGAMIAFDMGGPINKTAFFFGSGLIAQGDNHIMGPIAAAICIPPLGLGVATLIRGHLWTQSEREAGAAAIAMGCIGITEGAIPFAAADPLRVIPCIVVGSEVGATVAMLGHVGDNAPHGGLIVLPVVVGRGMYLVAIAAGVVVTAAAITLVKELTQGADVDVAKASIARTESRGIRP